MQSPEQFMCLLIVCWYTVGFQFLSWYKLIGLRFFLQYVLFISFFFNEFNKFNNTGAQMQDSIYHLTLKLF